MTTWLHVSRTLPGYLVSAIALIVVCALTLFAPRMSAQATSVEGKLVDLEFRLHLAEKRISELTTEVTALRKSSGGTAGVRVTAPFEVVDQQGSTIARIDESRGLTLHGAGRGLLVLNGQGNIAAVVRSLADSSGLVKVFDGKEQAGTSSAIGIGFRSLAIRDDKGTMRAVIGRPDGENRNILKFFSPSGAMLAGIGESQGGPGLIQVADESGNVRATAAVLQGHGVLAVRNTNGVPVAALGQEEDGRGLVVVRNGAGAGIAALTENDKIHGAGRMLVSDPSGGTAFVAGFNGQGGDACIAGKKETRCLGIGLPLR